MEHGIPLSVACFSFGFAIGLRMGHSFVKAPKRPKQSISEDWAHLHPVNKKRAARLIRAMLKIQEPAEVNAIRHLPARITDDLATAKRWTKQAGERARMEARR